MLKDKHAVSAKDYKHAKEVSNFKWRQWEIIMICV